MDLSLFAYIWLALAILAVALGIYRHVLESYEDETVHLAANEAAMVSRQKAAGKKIEVVARRFRWATLVAVLYGAALLAIYVHRAWTSGGPH